MKKLLFVLLTATLFVSCGDDQPVEEVVKLDTYEDKLSYVLGAMNAKGITDSNDPNVDRLDKEMMIEGFKEGLKDSETEDCMKTLQNLFGQNGQDFNETYAKEGSKCIGKITASSFMSEMKSLNEDKKLITDLLIKGFEHGVYAKDTIIAHEDQIKLVDEFFAGVGEKQAQKMKEKEKPFWAALKTKANVKEVAQGVYIETIKEGRGTSPTALDDVEAHYILTTVAGDTMETTRASGKPLKINLTYGMGQGIIQGWTIGFPAMKKGGLYKLYIPSELAYGKGSLCFEVELVNFGAQGSMVTLQQPEMPQGM